MTMRLPNRRWPKRPDYCGFAEDSQHPPYILEAFVRNDIMNEYEKLPVGKPFEVGTKFLKRDTVPDVGTFVKVQILCKPVKVPGFPGEKVTGCLMGGRIHTVLGPGRVQATVEATTLPSPLELEADWDVELVFRAEFEHPWVVERMWRN